MIQFNYLIGILGWLSTIFLLASICKKKFSNNKELPRKIIHIGTGPIIPLALQLGISKSLAVSIASFITIGLVVNHQIRLLPAIEDIQRKSYGTIAYGLSITLLIIFFLPKNIPAITAGILVMAFGDGFAGLIGREVKSKTWSFLGQTKSVAGTGAMFLVGACVLITINFFTGQPLDTLNLLSIALFAVGLEQVSFWGIDNFTVPIGVALSWIWLSTI